MQIVTAPWLRPADTLQAISSGAQAGLGLRAAMQRQAEAEAEQALARDRMAMAQFENQEKNRLMMQQMAMEQALKEQDMAARMEANALDNATRFQIANEGNILRQMQLDDTNKYRDRMATAREKEVEFRSRPKPFDGKTYHIGKSLVRETEPGVVSTIYNVPGEENLPKVSGIPLTADPQGPKVTLPVNHPHVNQLLETLQPGSSAALGTNWVERARSSQLSDADQSREAAKAAIQRAPSKRAQILDRLKKAGISTEGL